MEDVNISKYRAQVVRAGSTPASPGFVVSEGQDPVNPSGSSNYVPYSGAISNVDFGEFGLDTGFVTLDTTPTNIPTEQGGIYWDDARSTAALIMNGTLQHIGQDTFFYVKNSTGSSIPKGTAVRFDGTDGASGHLLIAPFLANGTYPSNYFMGVTAEAIANGSFGQVMHFGELTGVNTSGYTAGALLYASTSVAGAFQTTAPVAPNNIVLVAAAINSTNNGTILVRPTYGSNINQDEGVKITSGTTGDLLQLQAGGLWENKTLAQVIGSAYVPSTRTITINGTTQDLSANRTYNVGTVTAVTASSPLFSSGGTTPNITIQQASGSQSGFLSSTDWTTFNSKQNALTNPVTGTGTTNYLPKFTGSTTIGNSLFTDDGTNGAFGGANYASGTDLRSFNISATLYPGLAFWANNVRTGDIFSYGVTGNLILSADPTNIFTSSKIIFSVDGSEKVYITNSGDFGVGRIPSSGFKVDIQGNGGLRILDNDVLRSINITPPQSGVKGIIGTASGEGISLQATNDSGFVTIETAGTQRIFVNSTGLIGLGTSDITGVGSRLVVAQTGINILTIRSTNVSNTSAARLFFQTTNASSSTINSGFVESGLENTTSNSYLAFASNTTEKMRITSGGNLGIKTTTPGYTFTVGIDAETSTLQTYTNGTSGINQGAVIRAWTYSTENFARYTDIVSIGNWDGTNGKSVLRFFTQDSSTSPSVRLTIASTGAATFTSSVTAAAFNSFIHTAQGAGANGISDGPFIRYVNTTNSYQILKQINANTDEDIWTIRGGGWNKVGNLNATTGVYTALSDRNKKKDFEESTIGLKAILGLKPTLYRMKDQEETETKQLGFIAQEVRDYIPQACVEQENFIGLQDRPIIAALVKAIQEQQEIINHLKEKIQ